MALYLLYFDEKVEPNKSQELHASLTFTGRDLEVADKQPSKIVSLKRERTKNSESLKKSTQIK